MTKKNIITINNRPYDAVTGLPLAENALNAHVPAPVAAPPRPQQEVTSRVPAQHRKKTTQRSQTLRREAVKKPISPQQPIVNRAKTRHVSITKSPQVQKFAPHPVGKPQDVALARPTHSRTEPIRTANTVKAAHHRLTKAHSTSKQPSAMSSRELKQSMISESLQKATPAKPNAAHNENKLPLFSRPLKVSSVMAGSLAVVLLGGYLTYINMPGISTRVAASQAGVEASYPGYKPDGYRFKGPVAYNNGQVLVSFASNSGPQQYSIQQRESNWDSQTVLNNYILPETEDYTTNISQGITVYTFNGGAAWVNKGIFYTIEGNATLSTEQVLRIANSM